MKIRSPSPVLQRIHSSLHGHPKTHWHIFFCFTINRIVQQCVTFHHVSNELPNYHNPTFLGFGTRHFAIACLHPFIQSRNMLFSIYACAVARLLQARYFLKRKMLQQMHEERTHNGAKKRQKHSKQNKITKKNCLRRAVHTFFMEAKRKDVGKQKTSSCMKVGVSCLASCVWTDIAEKRSCLNAGQLFLQRERGPRALARDVLLSFASLFRDSFTMPRHS